MARQIRRFISIPTILILLHVGGGLAGAIPVMLDPGLDSTQREGGGRTVSVEAVGYRVELREDRFSVYRASDRALLVASSPEAFWARAGVATGGRLFEQPTITFDSARGRWFVTAAASNPAGKSFLRAVSRTSDPTGIWTAVRVPDSSELTLEDVIGPNAEGATMFSAGDSGGMATDTMWFDAGLIDPAGGPLAFGDLAMSGARGFGDFGGSAAGTAQYAGGALLGSAVFVGGAGAGSAGMPTPSVASKTSLSVTTSSGVPSDGGAAGLLRRGMDDVTGTTPSPPIGSPALDSMMSRPSTRISLGASPGAPSEQAIMVQLMLQELFYLNHIGLGVAPSWSPNGNAGHGVAPPWPDHQGGWRDVDLNLTSSLSQSSTIPTDLSSVSGIGVTAVTAPATLVMVLSATLILFVVNRPRRPARRPSISAATATSRKKVRHD